MGLLHRYLPKFEARFKAKPANIDALVAQLQHQDPKQFKGLPVDKKLKLLKEYVNTLRRSVERFKSLTPDQIIIVASFRSKLSDKERFRIFGHVKPESKMKEPVARYWADKGYDVFQEIAIGGGRNVADLVARKEQWAGNELIGVELKVDAKGMERALDQVANYQVGCQKVYFAATPYCIMEYTEKHGSNPLDTEPLERKLKSLGAGLILFDSTETRAPCEEIIGPATKKGFEQKTYDVTYDYLKGKAARLIMQKRR